MGRKSGLFAREQALWQDHKFSINADSVSDPKTNFTLLSCDTLGKLRRRTYRNMANPMDLHSEFQSCIGDRAIWRNLTDNDTPRGYLRGKEQ